MILALLILISAFLLNLILPWWSIAIPGLIFGYILNKKGWPSFAWGFLAVFLLWGVQAFYIDSQSYGILTQRIADMLGVGSPVIVILATALIGGVVSGFATLTGSLMKGKPSIE